MSTNNNAQTASNTADVQFILSYCKNVIKMIGLMFFVYSHYVVRE